MLESTDAEYKEKEMKLRQIAENMVNICETAFQDVLDTLKSEWKGDAPRLFVSRMEELQQETAKDAGNLINRL